MAGSNGTRGDRQDSMIEEVRNENVKGSDIEREEYDETLWDGGKLETSLLLRHTTEFVSMELSPTTLCSRTTGYSFAMKMKEHN
jgi:hypothetical protein